MAKKTIDTVEIEKMQDQHKWLACLALKAAFSNDMGQRQHLDWAKLCEAAYHAGAACVLYDVKW